jgi:hypothetical protein
MFKHDNKTWQKCNIMEAELLFTHNGKGTYFIQDVNFLREGASPKDWVVKCYSDDSADTHIFNEYDMDMLGLIPCRVKTELFQFRLESLSYKQLEEKLKSKGIKWQEEHAMWVVVPTDGTDFGNIEHMFPGQVFNATVPLER